MGAFRRLFGEALSFFYGRGALLSGGLKRFWGVWAIVYFSLVLREVLPFRTQVTFLGYPLVVLTVAGMLSLSLSSLLAHPVKFIAGLVPSGVPRVGAPVIIVLLLVRRLLRPFVLAMRLTMGAIIMVTLEGIFHFWCVKVGDLHVWDQGYRWSCVLSPLDLFFDTSFCDYHMAD